MNTPNGSSRKAIRLKEYLKPSHVFFLDEGTRDGVIAGMVKDLAREGVIPQQEHYLQALYKREEVASTGIGMGVAIPHAKLDAFPDFVIGIGVKNSGNGIEWDSLDGSPVRLVFMIGGPKKAQTEYLLLLSQLTKAIKDEEKRKALLSAENQDEIIEILSETLD